jgi:hypothetical protein
LRKELGVPELALAKLDWQALATLLTGVLAVGGAILIGLRQLRITRRQTEIAERQTRFAELSLRHQIFDKRMRVYDRVTLFLGMIIREGAYPVQLEADFLSALGASRFLFPAATYENLRTVWERAMAFRLLKNQMQKAFETEGHYGEGNPEQEEAALNWFHEQLESLPDLFGDELRLT